MKSWRLHDKSYVEPDICVICDIGKLTDEGCVGAPDWIIEIVSPESRPCQYLSRVLDQPDPAAHIRNCTEITCTYQESSCSHRNGKTRRIVNEPIKERNEYHEQIQHKPHRDPHHIKSRTQRTGAYRRLSERLCVQKGRHLLR